MKIDDDFMKAMLDGKVEIDYVKFKKLDKMTFGQAPSIINLVLKRKTLSSEIKQYISLKDLLLLLNK